MAHEVESMFSYREVPWHGLGTVVQEAPDAETALRLAGLDWEVRSEPIQLQDGTPVPGWRANVRSSDGAVLGVVSEDYRIVQNREAFAWVDALLGGGVRFETAGSLRGGRRVFLCTRLAEAFQLAGDPADCFLSFSTAHDGSGAVQAVVSPVRVVCMNTLNLATRQAVRSWRVRHTATVHDRLEEARRALALTQGYLAHLAAEAEALLAVPISTADWVRLCDHLLPPPEPDHTESERQAVQRMALQASLYHVDDLANIRHTAWGALNAVAYCTTHVFVGDALTRGRGRERAMREFLDGSPLLDQAYAWLKDFAKGA